MLLRCCETRLGDRRMEALGDAVLCGDNGGIRGPIIRGVLSLSYDAAFWGRACLDPIRNRVRHALTILPEFSKFIIKDYSR